MNIIVNKQNIVIVLKTHL